MNQGKLFIINPISGGKSKTKFVSFLKNHIGPHDDICIWYASQDAKKISLKIKSTPHQIVVAVGGDGTVNLVAGNLVGTDKILGIIPFGSGNGLARHLGLSMNPEKAFQFLERAIPRPIDVGMVNNQIFCCTCGFSFDAAVAYKFAKIESRGLKSYIAACISIMKTYEPPQFTITSNNGSFNGNFYILTLANANQYGNNVKIAPQATLDDGILELIMIKKPRAKMLFGIFCSLLAGKIQKNSHVLHAGVESCVITGDAPFVYHLDGESFNALQSAEILTLKKSLRVLSP